MKRISFIIIVFLVMGFTTAGLGQITLGPRIGANFSKLNLDSPYEIWKTGVVWGGLLKVPFKKDISFQGEFLISEKGYRLEFDGDNSYDELTSIYWEVPLLVNYTYPIGKVKFFGNAGVFAAYWNKGSYESKIGENEVLLENYEFTESPDSDGYMDNRIDYGLVGGLGILYDKIGVSGDIILEFRYTKGFAEIGSLEDAPSGYNPGTNSTFSISLAYMFYL